MKDQCISLHGAVGLCQVEILRLTSEKDMFVLFQILRLTAEKDTAAVQDTATNNTNRTKQGQEQLCSEKGFINYKSMFCWDACLGQHPAGSFKF